MASAQRKPTSRKRQLLLLFGTLTSLALLYHKTSVPTTKTASNLTRVLSSEDEESKSGPSNSGKSESDSKSEDRKAEDKSGSEGSTETTTSGGAVIRTEQKGEETRTETRLPSGVRVKTREEEGQTRVDIYQGATKLRLERRDDRTVIKLENKAGESTELPATEEEVFKIEQRADKGLVKIRTAGNKFVVDQASASATTKFPLSVNLATNELTVSTPKGEKVVTVLPAQAVQNMLAANVIDQVRGLVFTQDVQRSATSPATTLQDVISLTSTREGVLVYEIPGVQNQRFLGFIPIQVPKTAVVSAETGQLLEIQQTPLSRLLDIVSL